MKQIVLTIVCATCIGIWLLDMVNHRVRTKKDSIDILTVVSGKDTLIVSGRFGTNSSSASGSGGGQCNKSGDTLYEYFYFKAINQ